MDKVFGVTYNVFGTVTIDVAAGTEAKAEAIAEEKINDLLFGDLENIGVELCQTDEYEDMDPEELGAARWSVRGYRKDGTLKEEKELASELECARYCVAQLRMGYPAPTVWHYGSRVEGY